ncbi:MAG: threonylcarbamoyl-AMP synthase [Waddliaceae bacterium]|mgnify:CR=1 FL=1|nr:threonylcarbamoyl-AMP synthase [Waddliaceae bacterium]
MIISLPQAASLIQNGEVVAVPTDTVYGLAADSSDDIAVAEIFKIKGRPEKNPLVTLLADVEQIYQFVNDIPPHFEELAHTFWPGPLTLVIPIDVETVSTTIRAGLETAGFRVPESTTTRLLIQKCGPLVAPSANLSGQLPATTPEELEDIFGKKFPTLPADVHMSGTPSTILCYHDNHWIITRQGAITSQDINNIIDC